MRQTERRGLQNSTNNHDGGPKEDHLPSTKNVPNEDGDDRADEATNVVGSHGDTLDGGDVSVSGVIHCVDFGKLSDPASQCEESSHHTLVVTEKPVE